MNESAQRIDYVNYDVKEINDINIKRLQSLNEKLDKFTPSNKFPCQNSSSNEFHFDHISDIKKKHYNSKIYVLEKQIEINNEIFNEKIETVSNDLDDILISLEKLRLNSLNYQKQQIDSVKRFENLVDQHFFKMNQKHIEILNKTKKKVDAETDFLLSQIKQQKQEREESIRILQEYLSREPTQMIKLVSDEIFERQYSDDQIKRKITTDIEYLINATKELRLSREDKYEYFNRQINTIKHKYRNSVKEIRDKRINFDEYLRGVLEKTLNSLKEDI